MTPEARGKERVPELDLPARELPNVPEEAEPLSRSGSAWALGQRPLGFDHALTSKRD